MTHGGRLLGRGVCWSVLTGMCAGLCWLTVSVAAGGDANAPEQAWLLRLRSFASGATARLEIEPTKGGGRVRLTATHLPPPRTFAPSARVYLAWATGGRILRLGELRRDARGNAALEFAHPAPLERYSLIVTAEESARAEHPGGAPVFSTRANEVTAFFPAPELRPRNAASAARRTEASARPTNAEAPRTSPPPLPPVVRARRAAPGATAAADEFYTSIDNALAAGSNARDLTLVGVRRAGRARGYARVAAAAGTAYVRAHFRRVPPPARFGASRYVLWGMTADGRSVYLGSLPRRGLNSADTYTRAGGVDDKQFDLLVTAERGRRVRGLRRVLATVKSQRVYQGQRRARR